VADTVTSLYKWAESKPMDSAQHPTAIRGISVKICNVEKEILKIRFVYSWNKTTTSGENN